MALFRSTGFLAPLPPPIDPAYPYPTPTDPYAPRTPTGPYLPPPPEYPAYAPTNPTDPYPTPPPTDPSAPSPLPPPAPQPFDPGGRVVPDTPAEPPAGPPDDVPADLGPAPSGQTPDLTALLSLMGRGSGASSPGLQGLLESLMSGIGGGQARQRYGRQFQTFLANQRMAQSQRAEMAGMDQGADQGPASPLQGQMQMQAALDRLRTALDMPSRTPVSRRAPQFASSSSTSGGGLTATSPYLY